MTERDAVRILVSFVQGETGEVHEAIRVMLHHIKQREIETRTIEKLLERISQRIESKMPSPHQGALFQDAPRHPDL